MPIGPNQMAEDNMSVEKVINLIDNLLQDKQWVKTNRRVGNGNSYFVFIGEGELTEYEKWNIGVSYGPEGAGWSNVEVINSSENGERGGMWMVTLHDLKNYQR